MKDHALVSQEDYPLISNVTAIHHECQVEVISKRAKVNTQNGNDAYFHVSSDVL